MKWSIQSAWEDVCCSIDVCQFLNFRAADWNLNEPQWTGRLRLVAKGKDCILKLEDKTTGELFAKCPIDQYPGIAIEAVTDSSRYFVLRIQDDNGNVIILKCCLNSDYKASQYKRVASVLFIIIIMHAFFTHWFSVQMFIVTLCKNDLFCTLPILLCWRMW